MQDSCNSFTLSSLDTDQMECGGHGGRVRMRGDGYSDQDRCVMQGLASILGLKLDTE
jgi:hypothetical protein